jgi:glycosyltransferase involved in cell wall biosynthesis
MRVNMLRNVFRERVPRAILDSYFFRVPVSLLKGFAAKVLMQAQRRGAHAPLFLRKYGRRMLQHALRKSSPLDDWSTTLIGSLPLSLPAQEGEVPEHVPHASASVTRTSSPRLTCLIVTGVFDVGGCDEVVAFLGRRLPEHGIETIVVHTGKTVSLPRGEGGRLPSILRREGLTVEEVSEETAPEVIRRYSPDVISAHGAPAWWVTIAAKHNIPYVETIHGMHDLFDVDWDEEATRSTSVTSFIAVSEMVRQQYLSGNSLINPARVITVPNSVDPRRLPRLDRQKTREWLNLQDQFLFVSLARNSLQKNHFALVSAFEEVARAYPDAHLLIAGRSDDVVYTEQVRKLRDRLHCRERIHLRDHSPCPAALLAAADGFVLNSYFEGWSLASMEALYAGLPVILSEVGGAREQLTQVGECGYLISNPIGDALKVNWQMIGASLYVPQHNRRQLVGAMSLMIEEQESWASRRSRIRSMALASFHPDLALSKHAAILRDAFIQPGG